MLVGIVYAVGIITIGSAVIFAALFAWEEIIYRRKREGDH